MIVQVSDGTVSAYGPGSRFGTVYEDFGYTPTEAPVGDGGSHGEEISQEFFVEYDPDVLFVLDRAKAIGQDETPALDVLEDGLVGSTQAAQDDRIVEVDGFSWYLATSAPSSWQQMIDDVRASI
jgi:iron complex transport system substrate-binding protein